MNDFETFLEACAKEWFYRDDDSPLAELQYDIFLLTDNIEKMLGVCKRIHFNEKIEDFKEYREKYFTVLYKTILEFAVVVNKTCKIDKTFVRNVNLSTEDLMKAYNLKIEFLDTKEAKTVNDTVFAYQILLRLINTYIKNSSSKVNFVNVDDPLVYDTEPNDYLQFLKTFAEDQCILKLKD